MAQYDVEIPVVIRVDARSAVGAYATAMAMADALVNDGASYAFIRETDRPYSPARIRETLASRKKSIAAVIVDAKEHPNND